MNTEAKKVMNEVARFLTLPPMFRNMPLVISFGAGVDSTAMILLLWENGIRPDMIQFANVGNEAPDTYEHLETFSAWLKANTDFPEIQTVKSASPVAGHKSLGDQMLTNQTIPSLAFGHHSCSLLWKVDPQDKNVRNWQPAKDAWAAGKSVVKAIGYDNGDRDSCRSFKAQNSESAKKNGEGYAFWYPLQDADMDREACEALCKKYLGYIPRKSSCSFCPAMKKDEILAMEKDHPELIEMALLMEAKAAYGKHGLQSRKGLGMNFSWTEFLTGKKLPTWDDDPEGSRAKRAEYNRLENGTWKLKPEVEARRKLDKAQAEADERRRIADAAVAGAARSAEKLVAAKTEKAIAKAEGIAQRQAAKADAAVAKAEALEDIAQAAHAEWLALV